MRNVAPCSLWALQGSCGVGGKGVSGLVLGHGLEAA